MHMELSRPAIQQQQQQQPDWGDEETRYRQRNAVLRLWIAFGVASFDAATVSIQNWSAELRASNLAKSNRQVVQATEFDRHIVLLDP